MKNKVLGTVMGAALLAGSSVAVASDYFAAENFSATLTMTQDYVFRGTTFSNHDAAIQGSFDWGNGPWFAGVWASSQADLDLVNDSSFATSGGGGGTMEVDYYFGWADNLGGVDLMVMPLWYTYPGQEGSSTRDDTTFELWTTAGIGFDNIPGAPYLTLAVNYSDEFFACTLCTGDADSALYTSIAVAFSLPDGWGIDALYGYQDVGGDSSSGKVHSDFFGDDYGHWNVGVTKSAAGFDFDARYHDNSDQSTLDSYAGTDFAMDGDLVLSVSRSF